MKRNLLALSISSILVSSCSPSQYKVNPPTQSSSSSPRENKALTQMREYNERVLGNKSTTTEEEEEVTDSSSTRENEALTLMKENNERELGNKSTTTEVKEVLTKNADSIAAALNVLSILPLNTDSAFEHCTKARDYSLSQYLVNRDAVEYDFRECVKRVKKHLNTHIEFEKSILPDYKKLLAVSSDEEFAKLQRALEEKWSDEGIKRRHSTLDSDQDLGSYFPRIEQIGHHLFFPLRKLAKSIDEKQRKVEKERKRAEWEAGRPERERQERQRQQLQANKDRQFWTNAGQVVSVRSVREMQVGLKYGYRLVDKSYENPCTTLGGSCGSTVYTMMK